MTLNEWAANKKLAIFESLQNGRRPAEGEFDDAIFRQALTKGQPQVGATSYEPELVHFEYIFPDALSTATVLKVTIRPPERVVFMPVPEWVIEDIWQGEVKGTFHFESEARRLYDDLGRDVFDAANERWFGRQPARRRE